MIGVADRARRQQPMSTTSFSGFLKDVKTKIRETDVEAVKKVVADRGGKPGNGNGAGPVLVDVREKDEYLEGYIPGARWIPRGFLELRIEEQVPEKSSDVILYCAGGTRSALAARVAGRAGLQQRQLDGRRVPRLEAGRAGLRPALRDDPGPVHPLRPAHHAAGGRAGGAGQAAQVEDAAAGGRRAGLALGLLPGGGGRGDDGVDRRRHRRFLQPAAADPAQPPTGWGCRRWNRRRRR